MSRHRATSPWRLRRFHRKCDKLGVPGEVRERMIRMAEQSGEKLRAPDWYAGRTDHA